MRTAELLLEYETEVRLLREQLKDARADYYREGLDDAAAYVESLQDKDASFPRLQRIAAGIRNLEKKP